MPKPPLYQIAEMNRDQCDGAGIMLCFLMDIFALSGKKSLTPGEVVITLDLIGRRELPEGLIDRVKDARK